MGRSLTRRLGEAGPTVGAMRGAGTLTAGHAAVTLAQSPLPRQAPRLVLACRSMIALPRAVCSPRGDGRFPSTRRWLSALGGRAPRPRTTQQSCLMWPSLPAPACGPAGLLRSASRPAPAMIHGGKRRAVRCTGQAVAVAGGGRPRITRRRAGLAAVAVRAPANVTGAPRHPALLIERPRSRSHAQAKESAGRRGGGCPTLLPTKYTGFSCSRWGGCWSIHERNSCAVQHTTAHAAHAPCSYFPAMCYGTRLSTKPAGLKQARRARQQQQWGARAPRRSGTSQPIFAVCLQQWGVCGGCCCWPCRRASALPFQTMPGSSDPPRLCPSATRTAGRTPHAAHHNGDVTVRSKGWPRSRQAAGARRRWPRQAATHGCASLPPRALPTLV